MDDLKECREAFESEVHKRWESEINEPDLSRDSIGDYMDADMFSRFHWWQAAWNRRAVPQANAEQDALRWRTFEKALHSHLQGPAHGKKIKVIEVCPMYGDEKEVSNVTALIDAAIRAASKTTP